MITDIQLKNYRGVVDGQINGLRQLSVLTGSNNSAKTTVLEALAFVNATAHFRGRPFDGNMFANTVVGHRGLRGHIMSSLFADGKGPAQFVGRTDGGTQHDASLSDNGPNVLLSDATSALVNLPAAPGASTHFRTESLCFIAAPTSPDPADLESAVSLAEIRGYRHDVLAAARHVDSTINDLRILMVNNVPTLHAEATGGPRPKVWPIAVGGTGFKRYLTLAAQTGGVTGLVCLDDPDAFLHPGMYKHMADLVWGWVDSGAQVVLATHSPDLIEKLAEPINGDPKSSQFGVYGLTRTPAGQLSCALRLHGAAAQSPRRRDDIRQLLGI